METERSPYLNGNRLAEVIAALQATATYKFYQLHVEGETGWAYRIAGSDYESKAPEVLRVFKEHPEFFRIDSQDLASLVWRRQHPKLFDVDRGVEISRTDYEALTPEMKAPISRTPLEASEVSTLISAAVELHARAVAQEAAARWWITPVASVVSAFGGALIGGLIAVAAAP